ncbi:MAG: diaminopimelate epimerase [Parachlamydiales bacterium]|jgi:diaminopimelate epimerase
MNFEFFKYNSNGNDFVIIDDQNDLFDIKKSIIEKICYRQFCIGADGLILLKKSNVFDFKMQIFNSDGSEANMCGNGLLCLSKFVYDFIDKKKSFSVETRSSNYEISINDPFTSFLAPAPMIVSKNHNIKLQELEANLSLIDSGVMHGVMFLKNIDKTDVFTLGKKIRYSDQIPFPVNVDFCEVVNDKELKVRVYEKGVEDETLCCSTGALAAAKAFYEIKEHQSELLLHFKGGIIKISPMDNLFKLSGKPEFNFKGNCKLF